MSFMIKCVVCGKKLSSERTQIVFATKNKGVASACISHQSSTELDKYINDNGGAISVAQALREND